MGAIDMDSFEGARLLRDAEVVARLQRLVGEGRKVDVRLLVQLSEVDARRLFRDAGYSSPHAYCVGALRMSADEAFFRICAARLVRRFPAVLEMYRRQELHLSAIKLLSPVLTEENHDALLAEARCKTKRDLELVVARYSPKPDVADSMRRLPVRTSLATLPSTCQTFALTQGGLAGGLESRAGSQDESASCSEHNTLLAHSGFDCDAATSDRASRDSRWTTPIDPSAFESARNRDDQTACDPRQVPAIDPGPGARNALKQEQRESRRALLRHMNTNASSRPLSAERFHVQFTADSSLHKKLRQATELASSQTRRAGLAAVIDEAIVLFIAKRKRERFGVGSKVVRSTGRARQRSRYAPRAVRGVVFAREGARCAFVSPDGQRCSERCGLEYDHRNKSFGRGGEATAENLRLLCRAHNQLCAEQDYGRKLIRERIEQRRASEGPSRSRVTTPQPTTTEPAGKRAASSSESAGPGTCRAVARALSWEPTGRERRPPAARQPKHTQRAADSGPDRAPD